MYLFLISHIIIYVRDLFKRFSFTRSFVDSLVLNDNSFVLWMLFVIYLFINNEEIAVDKFYWITIYN